MLGSLVTVAALAVEPTVGTVVPDELVRVEDPSYPGALARTGTAALLAAPPADGTPWSYETLAVPDGVVGDFPGDAARAVLNADLWHARGWRGQGVHIAVFDIQWNLGTPLGGELEGLESADCWTHPSCEAPIDVVTARFPSETGAHGAACAEVVREVAPEARVSLVRVNGFSTFESAAAWAIRNDVDVVSMSLSFFNDSFYDGTGPFARVVEQLDAAGILLVTSAGNYARQHWAAPWRDADGDGRHDVDGTNGLDVILNGPGRRTVFVTWDEHFACGGSDLDAWIVDADGFIVGRGERRQDPSAPACEPVERVVAEVATAGPHRLVLHGRRVVAPYLGVDVLVQGGSVVEPVEGASLVDPASHPLAFTVGAVDVRGYLTNGPEAFSSRGPSRSGVPKPDIAGPDGLTTPTYGVRGFFGTSASTPAVAGAVAVVLSRWPELTPREASHRLQVWAFGDAPTWDDPGLGAGRARLPEPDADGDRGCLGGDRALLLVAPLVLLRRRRG